jgi:hypothetical protein
MKTRFILRLSLLILSTVIISYSFAQKSTELILAKVASKNSAGTATTEANKSLSVKTKIQQSFVNYFKTAEDASWEMIDNDFLVSFKSNNMRTRALFSKGGALLYTINYGNESDLPKDMYQQVKSTYYDSQITGAIHVLIGKQDIWIVNLKGNAGYTTLRMEEGEIEVMQQYHE